MTDTERGRDRGLIGARHTPGPRSYQHHTGCKSIGKKGPHRQSHIDIEVCCTVGLFNDAEDEANARLIASAPGLLAALKNAPPLPIGFASMNAADQMRFALDYADWWKDFCQTAIQQAEGRR